MNHPIGHAISALTLFGYIAGALPPIAALMAIIWYACQIGDFYVQHRRAKRYSRRIAEETQD